MDERLMGTGRLEVEAVCDFDVTEDGDTLDEVETLVTDLEND